MSLFTGIGAFEKALTNLGIAYELVGFSEIDKFAVKSYCLLHGHEEIKNLGDIRKIDTSLITEGIDLITYGFPCQAISLAGRMQGFKTADGKLTSSGLFVEALRIIRALQPKIAVAENVKGLLSKRFVNEFSFILDSLEAAGYNNYHKVFNAKDFLPQNRERVFIVSIRKDIDQGFEFPAVNPVKCRLADFLESNVPEKYYLSEQLVKGFIAKNGRSKDSSGFKFKVTDPESISSCIPATYHKCSSSICYVAGDLNHYSWDRLNRVYDVNGAAPTVTCMRGGSQHIKIYLEDDNKKD